MNMGKVDMIKLMRRFNISPKVLAVADVFTILLTFTKLSADGFESLL